MLVLKTGSQGENPCVLGTQQQMDDLGPGEVKLKGVDCSLCLGTEQVELEGQVVINGRTLEDIITQIVLEIVD